MLPRVETDVNKSKDDATTIGPPALLKRKYLVAKNIRMNRVIVSAEVRPIPSIEEEGSIDTFIVSSSVSHVNRPRIFVKNTETNFSGHVIGTRAPAIITTEETGTIIIFDRINHTGNLLNNEIVKGRVPA
jgi:hypothetical protein